MVLVTAFAITVTTFAKNFKYNFIKYLSSMLFIFALGSGAKSVCDFNAYLEDVREARDDLDLTDSDLELLKRWETWSYFSYFMLR